MDSDSGGTHSGVAGEEKSTAPSNGVTKIQCEPIDHNATYKLAVLVQHMLVETWPAPSS